MGNQYTKYGRDRQGPPAVSREDAHAAGFTEGPYYHSTDHADAVTSQGFRTKGAESWEIQDPGTMEEFKRFDSANPVWLGRNREETEGYGQHTLRVWAKPGAVRNGDGKTLAGGMYAPNPEHIVPEGLFNDRR